jgi:hypothetical protein
MSKAATPAVTDKSTAAATVNKADVAQTNGVEVNETKIRVQRSVKLDGLDTETASTEETIEVHAFATVPAMVGANFSTKISRNFQSVGLDILVQRPCYTEEIKQGIDEAVRIAKERVLREIPDIQRALNNVAGGGGQDSSSAQ